MAIIDKLLKRDPQDLAQRRLNQLPSLNQTELAALLNSDEAKEVKSEALLLLEYGDVLKRWAFGDDGDGLSKVASQRIADLIDNDSLTLQRLKDSTTLSQRLQIAGLVNNDNKFEQLLTDISAPNECLELAKNNGSARIRQWAAEKITDPQAQEELLKASKGKDKNVYKLMKARLDEKHEQERLERALNNRIVDLVEAITKHSQASVDHLYQAKRDHLWQQWQQVQSQADYAHTEKVTECFLVCDRLLGEANEDQQLEIVSEQPDIAPPPVSNVDVEKIIRQQQELVEGLKIVINDLLQAPEALDIQHIELSTKHIGGRWQDMLEQVAPEANLASLYDRLQKAIHYELSDIDTHGSLQQHLDSLIKAPVEVDNHVLAKQDKSIKRLNRRLQTAKEIGFAALDIDTVEQELRQWREQRAKDIEQQQNLLRQISGLIRKAQGALNSGSTGPAQGIRSTLREKSERFGTLPRHLEKQLQELDEQLDKVKDWKDYATLPKKRELLKQMQALVGIDEPPDALATKIKRLQEEWKLLSRGGFNDDGELWEQFRQAGDAAFEPCAAYFSDQGKIRQENIEKRERLVKQLQTYDANQDWEQADWRQVAKLVQMAFTEWHTYQPVERAANKDVQKDFDAIIGKIRDKLNDEHRRNKDQKKALLAQAEKLIDMDDNRAAIEQVKLLQERWKLIGSASHKADQALWKQFRKHCDQVFEKRKQINADFKAELNDNKSKALALINELHKFAQTGLTEMLAARERVEEIRNEFQAIGNLPKEKANELQKQFRNALDNIDKAIRREQAKIKAGAWDELLSVYAKLKDYCLTSAPEQSAEELKSTFESLLQASENWPKGGVNSLQKLLANVESNNHMADENQRRLLCIRAEILAGLDSPAEDHSLRMDYQVKQLAKGFGQAQHQFKNAKEALQSIMLEWVETVPQPEENYSALLARLNLCRQKVGL